jgi:hypothetical protein
MRKMMLMGGAALAALALTPALASAQEVSASGSIEYTNRVDATVDVDSYLDKDLTLFGGTLALGLVVTDSAAVAVVDNKQILAGNSVTFTEENELNGENGYVSSVFGPGVSESGQDPNDSLIDGVPQGNIRVGFFAPVINNVAGAGINATGNVGVNMAAGQLNVQENVAAIAASNYNDLNTDGTGDVTGHTGGWASASLISLQLATDNFYGASDADTLPQDDEGQGGGGNNYRDRNTVGAPTVGGAGNIGLNEAAGAFNMQKNALVIAVVADSALAEANAAVIQASYSNDVAVQDTINTVEGVSVTGSGNIGVNLAAGVGNMQQNSLVMALASGAAAPPAPTNGGTNGGNGGNGGGNGGDPS